MTTTAQDFIKVVLKKAHTHAGIKYEQGKQIALSQADADWLITHGIGDLVPEKKETEIKQEKEVKK